MTARSNDALSEVIGFVLIIALIAIIASLYLTYVVPSQGRDLEIAHMDVIQNQFYDYKTTVDALWLNGQYNTQVSSPFTLGTNPGSSQGSFLNMPLFQPVTSGGTMVVTTDDTITVTADALFDESPRDYQSSSNGNIWYTHVVEKPDHLYVNFSTTDISNQRSVSITPYPAQNGNWEVNISTLNSTPTRYNILTITILKNNNPTLSNLVINNSIAPNQAYIIDLADDAYGLKESFVYPFDLSIVPKPLVSSQPIGYHKISGATIIPNTKMGSLEYRSNNNYWISQNYIYQYGGVFLKQENGAVVKLLPSITIDSINQNLVHVSINNLTIPGTVPSKVGGSSLVEVLTTLTKPTISPSTLASGVPNAKSVTITIYARDSQTATMWSDTFRKIQQQSNAPTWINISTGPTTAVMTISNPVPDYNIVLDQQSNIANIYLSPTSY